MVEAISQCQRPDSAGLGKLVEPVGAQIQAADAATQGRRSAAFAYAKAVADALPALSWVVYSGPGCGGSPARAEPCMLPGVHLVTRQRMDLTLVMVPS